MIRTVQPSHAALGVAATALAVAAAGGVAVAAIPSSSTNQITACYPTSGASKGVLSVIDTDAGQTCPTGTAKLTWNATGVNFRGPWSSTTQYRKNDLVTSGGQTYIALLDNKNVAVTTATWALFAVKGSTGATGPTGPTFKGSFYTQPAGWVLDDSNTTSWQTVSTQTFTNASTANILAEYTAESQCINVSWCSVRVVLDGTEMIGGSGTGYAFDDSGPASGGWEGHAFNRYLASVPAGTHTVQVQAFAVGGGSTTTLRLDDATLTLEQIG